MTIDEAIHCMQSYLPDVGGKYDHCTKGCPYYASKKIADMENGYTCESNKAHELAIYALQCLKDDMTANEYQKLASRTINTDLSNNGQEFHALHGMVGEIGELHSIYQKEYQGHIELSDEHKMKEVGDLLWFIAEYCTASGWSLEEVMQMNIEKLKQRYPEGFDVEHSLHRKDGDI